MKNITIYAQVCTQGAFLQYNYVWLEVVELQGTRVSVLISGRTVDFSIKETVEFKTVTLMQEIQEAVKNDISVFAYCIATTDDEQAVVKMIAEQYLDNPAAITGMFGEKLVQKILGSVKKG